MRIVTTTSVLNGVGVSNVVDALSRRTACVILLAADSKHRVCLHRPYAVSIPGLPPTVLHAAWCIMGLTALQSRLIFII